MKPPVVAQPAAVALPPASAAPAIVVATPPTAVAKADQNVDKDRATPADEKTTRNAYTDEDAKRVAEAASRLKFSMPPFAIGETKADVPAAYQRFVGIWLAKVGPGEGRQKMVILTEALSDGLVLGHYVYGPAGKGSWDEKAPAGYVGIAAKISDGVLRFKSGIYPVELKLSGADALNMRISKPHEKMSGSGIKFMPLWQLVPKDRPKVGKLPGDRNNEDPRPAKKRTGEVSPSSDDKLQSQRAADADSTKALYAKCSAEGHRIAGGKHKNVGFSRIEACVRNGGQM